MSINKIARILIDENVNHFAPGLNELTVRMLRMKCSGRTRHPSHLQYFDQIRNFINIRSSGLKIA